MTSVPVRVTELVLRDGHQSLLATRVRLDDLLPVAADLDRSGFWSVESWGGATFDACIRYLGEDPWTRIREFSKAMPNTPQQMLLRGQNLLGYRHYADDVVDTFVERAVANGVGVFRVFDALNDVRNLKQSIAAVIKQGAHAQGTMSYTLSKVHTMDYWLNLAQQIEALGVHSIVIKDMSGLLAPYTAYELVTKLKQKIGVPIHLHSHATTGWAPLALLKAIEAGVDGVDTAISPMSGTYSHTATETIVGMLQGQPRDTNIDLSVLEPIAAHFRKVRDNYQAFEGSLKGIDARIINAQVPGGMLTNLESQLIQQKALHRFDELLQEIPRVRSDLGYIPLVTPTSQIVGTQAVLNILSGKRYANLSYETQALIRGEYGATPAAVSDELRTMVLGDKLPNTARPADALGSEMVKLRQQFTEIIANEEIDSSPDNTEDLLTFALFKDTAVYFLRNRHDASAFATEPPSGTFSNDISLQNQQSTPLKANDFGTKNISSEEMTSYHISVEGQQYQVFVRETDSATSLVTTEIQTRAQSADTATNHKPETMQKNESIVVSPLSGTVLKVLIQTNQKVAEGDVVCLVEAMKMETEIRSQYTGVVTRIHVQPGDQVDADAPLITLD